MLMKTILSPASNMVHYLVHHFEGSPILRQASGTQFVSIFWQLVGDSSIGPSWSSNGRGQLVARLSWICRW